MYRTIGLAAAVAFAALQGCVTSPPRMTANSPVPGSSTAAVPPLQTDISSPIPSTPVAHVTEIPVEPNAPDVAGHPLTSVVVTQCNLIVAVYMTMPDGRLLRFDHSAAVPPEQLMSMAYSATRSERVEVSCNDSGPQGYERHDPV